MVENILEVKQLAKSYKNFHAVNGISFVVPKGRVIGFLGPNGAGKTTTIQMLLGITLATSGDISYFGKNFFEHRIDCLKRINFTSAFNELQGRISVGENLLVFALLYGVRNPHQKIKEYADYFEIPQLLSQRYRELSAGQKTRVNLIKSLLNEPELILMDEPTASLDPDIADKMLTLIETLRREKNLSILYTSHDMNEVTRICDEVIFLDHGKIVAQDTPIGLTKRIQVATIRLVFDHDKNDVANYLQRHKYSFMFENDYIVEIQTKEEAIPTIIFGLGKNQVHITDIEIKKPTLEDVFLLIARDT